MLIICIFYLHLGHVRDNIHVSLAGSSFCSEGKQGAPSRRSRQCLWAASESGTITCIAPFFSSLFLFLFNFVKLPILKFKQFKKSKFEQEFE
jgi:hypothetical protein